MYVLDRLRHLHCFFMPRKLRVEYSDSIYHVVNRGNYKSFVH